MASNGPDEKSERTAAYRALLKAYWRTNLKALALLLSIWALVGLGCGVLFADALNETFGFLVRPTREHHHVRVAHPDLLPVHEPPRCEAPPGFGSPEKE